MTKNRRHDIVKPSKYKTSICTFYVSPEGCPFGDKCAFAHGEAELREETKEPTSSSTLAEASRPESPSGRLSSSSSSHSDEGSLSTKTRGKGVGAESSRHCNNGSAVTAKVPEAAHAQAALSRTGTTKAGKKHKQQQQQQQHATLHLPSAVLPPTAPSPSYIPYYSVNAEMSLNSTSKAGGGAVVFTERGIPLTIPTGIGNHPFFAINSNQHPINSVVSEVHMSPLPAYAPPQCAHPPMQQQPSHPQQHRQQQSQQQSAAYDDRPARRRGGAVVSSNTMVHVGHRGGAAGGGVCQQQRVFAGAAGSHHHFFDLSCRQQQQQQQQGPSEYYVAGTLAGTAAAGNTSNTSGANSHLMSLPQNGMMPFLSGTPVPACMRLDSGETVTAACFQTLMASSMPPTVVHIPLDPSTRSGDGEGISAFCQQQHQQQQQQQRQQRQDDRGFTTDAFIQQVATGSGGSVLYSPVSPPVVMQQLHQSYPPSSQFQLFGAFADDLVGFSAAAVPDTYVNRPSCVAQAVCGQTVGTEGAGGTDDDYTNPEGLGTLIDNWLQNHHNSDDTSPGSAAPAVPQTPPQTSVPVFETTENPPTTAPARVSAVPLFTAHSTKSVTAALNKPVQLDSAAEPSNRSGAAPSKPPLLCSVTREGASKAKPQTHRPVMVNKFQSSCSAEGESDSLLLYCAQKNTVFYFTRKQKETAREGTGADVHAEEMLKLPPTETPATCAPWCVPPNTRFRSGKTKQLVMGEDTSEDIEYCI